MRMSVRCARRFVPLLALAVGVAAAMSWLGAASVWSALALAATYALAVLGVGLVVGQSGQLTLGHGALFALGAYAQALAVRAGWPAPLALPLAALAGALGGLLASLPARRLEGVYFGMSTLAFALIVEEALTRAETFTHGAAGLLVPAFAVGDWRATSPLAQALLSLALLVGALWLCQRVLQGPAERAWQAVKRDEAAAAHCGVATATVKMQAFLLGGALAGLGGALYAHWIGFLSPEQFGLLLSFELLMMAFIGGVERLDGALWGALVFVALPPVLSALRSLLPPQLAATAGLEGVLLGVVIVALVIWRPQGLAGGRRPPAQ